MDLDYSRILYGPAYRIQGVSVVLNVNGTDYPQSGQPLLIAKDQTAGVELSGGQVDIETIRPAASFLVSDLLNLGIAIDDLDQSLLTMNGQQRKITSHKALGTPNGEINGEVYCFLEGI